MISWQLSDSRTWKSYKKPVNFRNRRSQRKCCIATSRFHEINRKMEPLYKNRLKPVKCRITPLLLRACLCSNFLSPIFSPYLYSLEHVTLWNWWLKTVSGTVCKCPSTKGAKKMSTHLTGVKKMKKCNWTFHENWRKSC